MRWCVVLFFSRSCFIQTENNINHMTTNKTNIWLEGDARSAAFAPCVPPRPCFECQSSRGSASAFVRTSPRFSDPFPLTLRSSWKRRRWWRSTEGGQMNTLSVRFVHVSACCPSCKTTTKKKKVKFWNVLVVYSCRPSATVATSSNMCFTFHFYVLCFFPVFFFFVFSVFSFFVFHFVPGGARLKSFSATGTRRPHKAS